MRCVCHVKTKQNGQSAPDSTSLHQCRSLYKLVWFLAADSVTRRHAGSVLDAHTHLRWIYIVCLCRRHALVLCKSLIISMAVCAVHLTRPTTGKIHETRLISIIQWRLPVVCSVPRVSTLQLCGSFESSRKVMNQVWFTKPEHAVCISSQYIIMY